MQVTTPFITVVFPNEYSLKKNNLLRTDWNKLRHTDWKGQQNKHTDIIMPGGSSKDLGNVSLPGMPRLFPPSCPRRGSLQFDVDHDT